MSFTICAVLKSGGDFDLRHAAWWKRQVREVYPDADIRLYSDMSCGFPLKMGLPRWWSKYEAYADPTLRGPILMLDLDVVLLKPWLPPDPSATYLVADSNRIGLPGRDRAFIGAFCYLQEADRKILADDFFANPIKAMATVNSDDQPRLTRLLPHATTVQHIDPDAVALYKVHVVHMGVQPGNKIILFHGQPRPWASGESWVPPLES